MGAAFELEGCLWQKMEESVASGSFLVLDNVED